ncbi:hypothetical protein O7542_03285 [Micromonospora sp. WMMC264]|uniref:hypothetical protein n=1 Tax=Micromonospora sp. WMMC264 TaxID=3015158 RepID=UPI00248AE31C|nr:hypothetical protein [Micromonospora sp. WMMC264]WBB86181.1 hypothetical protein O7542_03285 [Micromonospora sp. WMMC264]
MLWLLSGLFLSLVAPYLTIRWACSFMMALRVSISAKLSPRLPFLASQPYRLNPIRPVVRTFLGWLLGRVSAHRGTSLLIDRFNRAIIRKSNSWRAANQGPPMVAVWANLGRFFWLGLIGSFLATIAIGVPCGIGYLLVRMAAAANQQDYVQGMAASLITTVFMAAIYGFSIVASGASKIAKSPHSVELRRISKSSGMISNRSFLESSMALYSYSLLRLAPFFLTYLFATSFLIISTESRSLDKIKADLLGDLPLLVSGFFVASGVVAYFLVVRRKVRAVRRQMEPTRALMALLDQTSQQDEGEASYGKYSPIPDPLGHWRHGLALLAQQMRSSAIFIAPELRQLLVPHPLSRVLDGLDVAIRRTLVNPVTPDAVPVKEIRGTLELVVSCLAEPRDPGLLHAAGLAVEKLAPEVAGEELPASSRKGWSMNRLVAVLDLVDGPTKAFNAAAAMGAFTLALYGAVNGGDFSGLTKLIFK